MITLTCRLAMIGAAAAGITTRLPASSPRAQAAAPLGGQQAPGWYHHGVGHGEATVATNSVNRFCLLDGIVANRNREPVNTALAGSAPRASSQASWRAAVAPRA